MSEQYADIMGRDSSFGTYVFKPQPFTRLRLGSVGYFDRTAEWQEITNLFEPGLAEKDGFKPFLGNLSLREVTESKWQATSGETETGRSSRISTEASGAMAAAPVEASLQVKAKKSKTGSASLITSSTVRNHRFDRNFKGPMMDWVESNAQDILASCRDIKSQGLWIVMSAWVTDEAAVKMSSGENQDIDVSMDLGATGIGKLGTSVGVFDKLQREGWWTYDKDEKTQGYVVSFAGVQYSARGLSKFFRSVPLEVANETISLPVPRPPAEQDESNKPDGSDSPVEEDPIDESAYNEDEDGMEAFGLSDDENDAGVNFKKEKAERQDEIVSKLKQLWTNGTAEQIRVELSAIFQDSPNDLKSLLDERPELMNVLYELRMRWKENS
ncbi:hypothetical protein VI817_001144 [Penicillium citrinum]|nr:hypothetical protein VI817_001144 [Penicillium citrinum]